MSIFRIGDEILSPDAASFTAALASAHAGKLRAWCLCRPAGSPMYVARHEGRFILKRMPNTGALHDPACESYEPPAELSGLGQVMGSAIHEDIDSGTIDVRLDFALTKLGGRGAPVPSESTADTVKASGSRLSLRALLHFLWDQAGFTRWSPAMAGRRNWFVIRKYLLQAAENKSTKGQPLAAVLYVPESFSVAQREEVASRRLAFMSRTQTLSHGAPVTHGTKAGRQLLLAIGEVKEIAPARYGHRLVFKHLPDCPFLLGDDLHRRLEKRFATELALWTAVDAAALVAIVTFSLDVAGVPSVEAMSLMMVTEHWIPFESMNEHALIAAMTAAGRRFVKGLRYNLPAGRPLATLVASDTAPQPTAMYCVPVNVDDAYRAALRQLFEQSAFAAWVWEAAARAMPSLPALPARKPACPTDGQREPLS